MRITRLGQGVDRTGRLAPEAIERTVAVLAEYRPGDGRPRRAGRVRMAATSAGRDASEPRRVLRRRRSGGRRPPRAAVGRRGGASCRSAGPPPTSTRRSGRSWCSTSAAARPSSCTAPPRPEGGIEASSIDVGCVRLTEGTSSTIRPHPRSWRRPSATPTPGSRTSARRSRSSPRRGPSSAWPGRSAPSPPSSWGSPIYDHDALHHFVLDKEAAEDVFRTLATEARADRLHNPGWRRPAPT